jgi:MoaA/NifB/PqqE/SkfB family radical SAM enzyme
LSATSLWGVPVPRLLQPLDRVLAAGLPTPVAAVIHHSPFLHPERPNAVFDELLTSLRARLPELRLILDDGYLGTMHYVEVDRADLLARHPALDFACQYETDAILPALLEDIVAGAAPPRSAPATARVLRQGRAVLPAQMAAPAWSLVAAASYARFLRAAFDRLRRPNPFRIAPDTRPIVTSRGCPFGCTFCSSNPYLRQRPALAKPSGPRFRAVPLAAIAHELEVLRTQQGAHHLAVLDAVANVRPDFTALLDLMNEREFVYDFPNGLRADHLTDEHLDRMRGRIGTLSVSAESGNQDVVHHIVQKGLALAEVERVAKAAQARAIPLVVHFMVGLPGETRSQVQDTLTWALALHERYGAEPLMSFATPIPGTALYDTCVSLGLARQAAADDPAEHIQHAAAIDGRTFSPTALKAAVGVFRRHVRAQKPHKLIVNLTYRCQNHCAFCAVGDPLRPRAGATTDPRAGRLVGLEPVARDDAPLDEVRAALKAARRDGVTLLDLDGGEPLLYRIARNGDSGRTAARLRARHADDERATARQRRRGGGAARFGAARALDLVARGDGGGPRSVDGGTRQLPRDGGGA